MSNKYIVAIETEMARLADEIHKLEGMKRMLISIDEGGSVKSTHKKKPVLGKTKQQPRGGLSKKIIEYLEAHPGPATSRDLIDYTGEKDHRVWTLLSDMKKTGELSYDLNTRTYTINREPDDEASSS